MKKLTTLLLLSVWTLSAHTQILKKTYYDIWEKNVHEVYYANSAGYGNGSYKKYDERGALIETGAYSNGKKTGEWVKYVTYTGKRTVSLKETYKDDKLNGSAIYYADGDRVMSKGSYLEDEKHGTWQYENPNETYGLSDEDAKGAKYLKFSKHYDKGKEIHPDGEEKIYYSPSGQVCSVSNYIGGNKQGEWKYYFPNGDLSGTELYDGGKLVMAKYFHPNKQLKLYKDWRNGYTYEGYDENGNPDQETLRQQKIITAKAEFEKKNFNEAAELFTAASAKDDAKTMQNLAKGKAFSEEKKYQSSIKFIAYENSRVTNPIIQEMYNEIYPLFITEFDAKMNKLAQELDAEAMDTELKEMISYLKKEDADRYPPMITKAKASLQEQIDIEKTAMGLYGAYLKDNVVQKKTILVDDKGQPIMKDDYPKGEHLYLKSKIILDKYRMSFLTENDWGKRKVLGNKLIEAIGILNKIPESEWKSLNKSLKKVDDPEQIKAILKI